MASGRANGVDPRREKLLDFRHRGRCSCRMCKGWKADQRAEARRREAERLRTLHPDPAPRADGDRPGQIRDNEGGR